MLEKILDYEGEAFLWLNSYHTPFENQFMWLFSGKIFWIPSMILFIFMLFYKNIKHWKETLIILMAIALVITLCDQFASGICKPIFTRSRPTHHPEFMDKVRTVFDYRGGRFGFISSHAANAFGFATLTSLIFKYRFYSVVLYLWAIINSYSRIYLGVHFISDIIPGIIVGLLFGWGVYKLFVFACKKMPVYKTAVNNCRMKEIFRIQTCSSENLNIILYMLIFTVAVMLIISSLYALKLISSVTIK
ncbi:MAG: phosphatase PAP2 family protein [Tannerella sp.]|jgi:undecaprenyl-diphosphatase|nr:phosphatase PAP2 family protein [Tannerella sp.]